MERLILMEESAMVNQSLDCGDTWTATVGVGTSRSYSPATALGVPVLPGQGARLTSGSAGPLRSVFQRS